MATPFSGMFRFPFHAIKVETHCLFLMLLNQLIQTEVQVAPKPYKCAPSVSSYFGIHWGLCTSHSIDTNCEFSQIILDMILHYHTARKTVSNHTQNRVIVFKCATPSTEETINELKTTHFNLSPECLFDLLF